MRDFEYGIAWGLLGAAFSLATDYDFLTTIGICILVGFGVAVLTDWILWRVRSGG